MVVLCNTACAEDVSFLRSSRTKFPSNELQLIQAFMSERLIKDLNNSQSNTTLTGVDFVICS